MHKFIYLLTITAALVLDYTCLIGQNRWIKIYHDEIDAFGDKIIESYDHGYLLLGRFGHNYPKYLWLIKTDINGEILWEKVLGDGINTLVYLDLEQTDFGSIYLAGMDFTYDSAGDPIIMKLDSCGEKEWCRIFYTENNMDYSSCITLTPEGEPVIVLNLTNPTPNVEWICLAKLSPEGELLWRHCFTSADTNQRGEISYDIILTPDNGFLVTGHCYYQDPEVTNLWWLHPYYLKVDSLGNFEWETVVYKETNLHGGIANSMVISPNGQYFYSSISHYNNTNYFASPALAKLDMQGNVIAVYDVVTGYYEGKLSYAQFLNDSTLAASAGWGNSDDDLWSRAVIIDTLGNLLNSTVLMQDLYTSILEIAFDGKLVYASNTYQNNQFDFFLTKLNQNLEDDTLYTRPFTYDSLCPYQIVSDTIVQDDCGLIVGVEEEDKTVGQYNGKKGELVVWPNPCGEVLSVKCLDLNEGTLSSTFNLQPLITIYDVFGRTAPVPIPGPSPSRRKGEWQLDVSTLPPGIYMVVVKDEREIIGAGKFIIAR